MLLILSLYFSPISGECLFTTAWRVLRLRTEERVCIYGGLAANILNKKSRTVDMGWSPDYGLGVGLITRRKNKFVTKCHEGLWT
jgi:hypothetical protein